MKTKKCSNKRKAGNQHVMPMEENHGRISPIKNAKRYNKNPIKNVKRYNKNHSYAFAFT